MTKPRYTIIDEEVVGTYHCMSRCVRRGFLFGTDPITKRNFDHRKEWVEQRLIELSRSFLIDVGGYAIMDNHIHVVIRNRPDLAKQCSDHEVIRRWWQIFPKRRTPEGLPAELTQEDLDRIAIQRNQIAKWRSRLASPSWFMGRWKEPIARRANREDNCRGHFWESRYKSVALLDDAAILACSAYVDLNPIRADCAESPETSDFTSIQRRILTHQAHKQKDLIDKLDDGYIKQKLAKQIQKWLIYDEWLCPLLDKGEKRGFLKIGLEKYLNLLDWTGRRMTAKKRV